MGTTNSTPMTGTIKETSANGRDGQYFLGGTSPAIREIERIIAEIAPTDISVLLVGESGAGKEVVAQRVHRLSPRRDEPFVKLVCPTLFLEALDLGPRNGDRGGVVQGMSSAGTIFLDEVGDLDPACQSRLLHLLPDDSVNPDGALVRARVISSSVRELEDSVRSGRLREVLYYRLNGVCLRLPPLRQRKEDIPSLVDFFLTKHSNLFGRHKPVLSPAALGRLVDYAWPGNIRQLENIVKKFVALDDERLALADLDTIDAARKAQNGLPEKFSLKEASRAASQQAERQLILKTLERTRWNRKRAAKELQISYKALLYKLKRIGMEDSEESLNSDGKSR